MASLPTTKRGIYFLTLDSINLSFIEVIIMQVLKTQFRKPRPIKGLLVDSKESTA